jgi:hypothetical protein
MLDLVILDPCQELRVKNAQPLFLGMVTAGSIPGVKDANVDKIFKLVPPPPIIGEPLLGAALGKNSCNGRDDGEVSHPVLLDRLEQAFQCKPVSSRHFEFFFSVRLLEKIVSSFLRTSG